MGYRLDTLAESPDNNLRIMRLVTASAVIFSHGYVVNLGLASLEREPLAMLTGIDCGKIAVDVFFVVSGFLVTRSLLHSRNPVDFLVSRGLRIYPGLICVVLLLALVLGPMVTELSLGAYFRDQWLYRFLLFDTTSLLPSRFVARLPGVFAHLPFAHVVTLSLWTLPWEMCMYLALLGLFLVRGLGRAYAGVLCVIALTFAAITFHIWQPSQLIIEGTRFFAMFHAGVAAYRFRGRITLSWPMLAGVVAVMCIVNTATDSALLLPPCLAYLVIFLAYHPALVVERWCEGPDYSYGTYVYGSSVQQTLVWAFGPMAVFPSFLLAWGLTMPLAMLSWHLIEKPALTLKSTFRARRDLSRSFMRSRPSPTL